jgi:hypothetical protein
MGIEPTSEAWEASILPLYDARSLYKTNKTGSGPQALALSRSGSVSIVTTLLPVQPSGLAGILNRLGSRR